MVVHYAFGQRVDWQLDLSHAATIGEVADAVGLRGEVLVDGLAVAHDRTAVGAGLVDGADLTEVLHTSASAWPGEDRVEAVSTPVVELRHVAGPEAGGTVGLGPGGHHVGRARAPGLRGTRPASTSFTLAVEQDGTAVVAERGASVLLDGEVVAVPTAVAGRPFTVGNDVFELHAVASDDGVEPPAVRSPASLPPAPPRAAGPSLLGWAGVAAGIVLLVVLAAVVVRPSLAVLAVVATLVAAAAWLLLRELQERALARHRTEVAAAREEGERVLLGLRRDEERRRRTAHLDPAEVVARTTGTASARAPHRRGATRTGVASVATASEPWTPPVDGLDDPFHRDLVEANATLHAVPVTVDLQRPLGLVGPVDITRSLVRHVVLSMAAQHAVEELELGLRVPADAVEEWDWAKWLPHLDAGRVCTEVGFVPALLRRWTASAAEGAAPRRVMVVDLGDAPVGRAAAIEQALAVPAGHRDAVSAVWLAPSRAALPEGVETVVTVPGWDEPAIVTGPDGSTREGVPRGMAADLADRAARGIAREHADERADAEAGLPHHVRLAELLALPDLTGRAVAEAWLAVRGDPLPTTPIGVTSDGPLWLDLVIDGPHVLLEGGDEVTRDWLLRTLVCGLASSCGPEHLHLLLLDTRAGGSFGPVRDLPHVADAPDGLDDVEARRIAHGLLAELDRREQVLRDADVADLAAHRRTLEPALPRVVVVVDDLATVGDRSPGLLASLVDVAERGPRLGLHLLLGTSDHGLVRDVGLRAERNVRIGLGTSPSDATTNGAPRPARHAGRALVRFGSAEPVAVRTAGTSGVPPVRVTGPRVLASHFALLHQRAGAPGGRGPRTGVRRGDAGGSDLDAFVAAAVDASRRVGMSAGPRADGSVGRAEGPAPARVEQV